MDRPFDIQENVHIAPMTTIGLGGTARFFVRWRELDGVRTTLSWARENGFPVQVIGGGSNILFPDSGFRGLVAKNELMGIAIRREKGQATINAGAGESWDNLVSRSVEMGWGGLECTSGIPGLVGATPVQNVGAYGQEVGECIVEVEAIDRESLQMQRFTNAQCDFGYRRSRFKTSDRNRFVITRVTYRLSDPGVPDLRYPELERTVRQQLDLEANSRGVEAMSIIREAVLKLRRKKSMVIDPEDDNSQSMGSFFLNPVVDPENLLVLRERLGNDLPAFEAEGGYKLPAAWLVERSGFAKGHRRNGARISSNHALALVSCGGTTADLLQLAREIQKAVFDRCGIHLEPEPVILENESQLN